MVIGELIQHLKMYGKIDMTKPIGATQQQLEENNIEWVYRPDYTHRNVYEPMWELRHSSEYEWAKERTMLLQEIANLKRINKNLQNQIDADYWPSA